jgi:hypothetical protein
MVEDKCDERKDAPMIDRNVVHTEIRPVDETEKKQGQHLFSSQGGKHQCFCYGA